ncbi:MAG: BamA/TamA family outer membrane protein [Bacteroidota bacterium]
MNGSIRFFNFPDSYFGIGNSNDPDISEQYTNIFFQLEGRYLKPLNRTAFLGIGWDIQHNSIREIEEGGLLQTDGPVGISGGTVLGIGPAFRFDSRNNTIYPNKGYLITYRSLLNYLGDFRFSSHLIDLRKYIIIGNEHNILAFQLRGSFTNGNDAPFYKLPQLGGDERLRGINNASLYRDRQMVYAQAEYRRPLFWRFGMTLFAGIGDVANELGDLQLSDFKYVGGIGGRFAAIPEDKLNLRIDLGVARGGQVAFYAGISEAF